MDRIALLLLGLFAATVIISVQAQDATAGFDCLHCESTTNRSACSSTITCLDDEVCYFTIRVERTGSPPFIKKGCTPRNHCTEMDLITCSRARQRSCGYCCNGPLCNLVEFNINHLGSELVVTRTLSPGDGPVTRTPSPRQASNNRRSFLQHLDGDRDKLRPFIQRFVEHRNRLRPFIQRFTELRERQRAFFQRNQPLTPTATPEPTTTTPVLTTKTTTTTPFPTITAATTIAPITSLEPAVSLHPDNRTSAQSVEDRTSAGSVVINCEQQKRALNAVRRELQRLQGRMPTTSLAPAMFLQEEEDGPRGAPSEEVDCTQLERLLVSTFGQLLRLQRSMLQDTVN